MGKLATQCSSKTIPWGKKMSRIQAGKQMEKKNFFKIVQIFRAHQHESGLYLGFDLVTLRHSGGLKSDLRQRTPLVW